DLPGWNPQDFERNLAAVKAALAGPEQRLLILDNVEDPQLLAADWRPKTGGCHILITSRKLNWRGTGQVTPLTLGGPPRAQELLLLLAARAGEQGTDALLADAMNAQAANAICDELEDLPLALTVAGAYLQAAAVSLPGYLARLQQAREQETLLDHPSLAA